MLITLDLDKVSERIREELASTLESPVQLEKLSKDVYSVVRIKVALNPCTSFRTLVSLADDPDFMVRATVASHYKTDQKTLIKLSNDADAYVRYRAITMLWKNFQIKI